MPTPGLDVTTTEDILAMLLVEGGAIAMGGEATGAAQEAQDAVLGSEYFRIESYLSKNDDEYKTIVRLIKCKAGGSVASQGCDGETLETIEKTGVRP